MPRVKGSGSYGPVRSLRLPRDLDAWFEERLVGASQSSSELLLELIHGGLRLRNGYMTRSKERIIALRRLDSGRADDYVEALRDTFGDAYVEHLERWIVAEEATAAMKL